VSETTIRLRKPFSLSEDPAPSPQGHSEAESAGLQEAVEIQLRQFSKERRLAQSQPIPLKQRQREFSPQLGLSQSG
jgi:hypothetical protein